MGYCDYTDEWLRDLTRERRAEARARRPEPVRYSMQGDEYTGPVGQFCFSVSRRRGAMKAWRKRQWKDGNRRCTYCRIKMTLAPKHGHPTETTVTVDHLHPLALGGDDAAWNWGMCCWGCNNAKGFMLESKYRALLAATFSPSPPQPPRRDWPPLP